MCLEDRATTVKMFYQDTLLKKKEKEDKRDDYSRQDYNRGGGGGYNRYGGYNRNGKDERVDVVLEYNPYANLDSAAANALEIQVNTGELKYQQDELFEYCLPQHKSSIEYFKIMKHDIYECEKRYLPNIVLIITSNNEVFLWQENLMVVSFLMTHFISLA